MLRIGLSHHVSLMSLTLLAFGSQARAQSADAWRTPVALRMENPDFPTVPGGDYFAPLHGILSPGGDVMLFGFRQSVEQISQKEFLHRRTGSIGRPSTPIPTRSCRQPDAV